MRTKYNYFKRHDDRETLERIKRWPKLHGRFPFVRIYSAEHSAFWRGTGQGYTDNPQDSGVWTIKEAFARTNHCCPMKRIQFIGADQKEQKLEQLQSALAECEKENLLNASAVVALNKNLEELVKVLEKYGQHDHRCRVRHAIDEGCCCGLGQALKKVEETE